LNKDLVSMVSLIYYSMRKLFLRRRFVICIGIVIFVIIVMFYASISIDGDLFFGINLLDRLILSFFAALLSMIYGTTILAEDIEDKSLVNVLTSPVHRCVSFLGYYIALCVSVGIMMLLVTAAGFFAYFIPAGIGYRRLDIFISFFLLTFMATIVYTIFFLTLNLIIKRTIYFGLFYVFVWEGFVGFLPGRIRELTLSHYIRSLGSHVLTEGDISRYSGSSYLASIYVLTIFTILVLIIGCGLFWNKDFP